METGAESKVSLIKYIIDHGKKIGKYRQIELYSTYLNGAQLKQLRESVLWENVKPRVRPKNIKSDFVLLVGHRNEKLYQYMIVRISSKNLVANYDSYWTHNTEGWVQDFANFLDRSEQYFIKMGIALLKMKYVSFNKTFGIQEQILDQLGWETPKDIVHKYVILKKDQEDFRKIPFINKDYGKRYNILPYDIENEKILRKELSKNPIWSNYPRTLNPLVGEKILRRDASYLAFNDDKTALLGWCVVSQPDKNTLRVNALYTHINAPSFLGFALLAQSIKSMFDSGGANRVMFAVRDDNSNMMRVMNKVMGKKVSRIVHIRNATKKLINPN